MAERTEAQKRALSRGVAKYTKENYDRIEFKCRKEWNMKEAITEHCKKYNYIMTDGLHPGTLNKSEFIRKAVENQIKIDTGEYELVKK